jgi:hypothetical protein
MKKLNKIVGVILALCLLTSLATVAFAAPATEDTAVSYFTSEGYLLGDENGNLNIDSTITRAEFATLVNRVAGFTEKSENIAQYNDVKENAWYFNDLAVALGAGYLQGWNNGMHPNDTVTVEQVLTVISRVFGLKDTSTASLSAFSDADSISSWAKESVATAVNAGIVSGSALNPTSGATRGACVTALYNALTASDVLYGTATLTYAEFYSGDVSSTKGYDAVSSATNSKYSIMSNMSTDFVDADTNADGYHILGVKNVNVAVKSSDLSAFRAANPSFTITGITAPSQYKTVTVSGNNVTYSATKYNVADTVKTATATLLTASTWGDYQINVTDPEGTSYLRNTRTDDFPINSQIQGIILETSTGLKVGMEYLQSIWVQPYEVSFNVLSDNTHNTHIAQWDNLEELSKLVGQTVTKITYIMQNETYVYEFDGIYIKPTYTGSITATFGDGMKDVTLSTSNFSSIKNGNITVTYTIGSGRTAQSYTLLSSELKNGTATYALDNSVIADVEEGGTYKVTITSDNFADYTVSTPMTAVQSDSLKALVSQAQSIIAGGVSDATLSAHVEEAQELLNNKNATSAEASELIGELTSLIASATPSTGASSGNHGNH